MRDEHLPPGDFGSFVRAPTFISWSGMRAQTFGLALRGLLNATGDHFNPWISETDIPLGVNWRAEVDGGLQSAKAGIVLLTLENYRSPWLIYEAGRMVERDIKVIPIRVDLPATLLPRDYPLIEQSVANDENGIHKVVVTLNSVTSRPLSPDLLAKRFNRAWPDFAGKLERPFAVFSAKTKDDQHFCKAVFLDIAEEALRASCRSLALYAECSRILALTDWTAGFKLEANPVRDPAVQPKREHLAREFEALRHHVQASLSEPGSRDANATKADVAQLVEASERVHVEALESIENAIDHGKTELPEREKQKLEDFAKLSRQFHELREGFAPKHGSKTRADKGKLSDELERTLSDWRGTLPGQASCRATADVAK